MSELPKELNEKMNEFFKVSRFDQTPHNEAKFLAGAKAATQLEREKTKPLIEAIEEMALNMPYGFDSSSFREVAQTAWERFKEKEWRDNGNN